MTEAVVPDQKIYVGPENPPDPFHGVSCDGNNRYIAYINVGKKRRRVGLYSTLSSAAISYDVEMMRAYGLAKASELNFHYEVLSSSPGFLFVRTSSGLDINIDICEENYTDVSPIQLDESKRVKYNTYSVPTVLSEKPVLGDIKKNWSERLLTCYLPTACFAYEIVFPHANSLGLNLKPFYIMNAASGYSTGVGCMMVRDSTAFLSTVIQPGDVLLRVNDVELVSPCGAFSFKEVTQQVTKASAPRTLRLLRPGLRALCPVELQLMARATHPVAAKTTVVQESSAPGSSQVPLKLQLLHMDPQVPPAVRKAVQGKKIVWDVPPPQLQHSSSTALASATGSVSAAQHLSSKPNSQVTSTPGIHRDRGKFVVSVTSKAKEKRPPISYFVGRFDSEDEAISAQKKAQEELAVKGSLPSVAAKTAAVDKARLLIKTNPQAPPTPAPAPTPTPAPVPVVVDLSIASAPTAQSTSVLGPTGSGGVAPSGI